MGDAKGRDIVLNDQSNKTICKNVNLWAYQDRVSSDLHEWCNDPDAVSTMSSVKL